MRVRPVVRNLSCVVVAHDIDGLAELAARTDRVEMSAVCETLCEPTSVQKRGLGGERLADEAVHPPAVDVATRVLWAVRTALVAEVRIVEGADAVVRKWVRHADVHAAVPHRESVCPGVRAEVRIEGSVLLHDHDDVLDGVNSVRRRSARRIVLATPRGQRHGSDHDRQRRHSQDRTRQCAHPVQGARESTNLHRTTPLRFRC